MVQKQKICSSFKIISVDHGLLTTSITRSVTEMILLYRLASETLIRLVRQSNIKEHNYQTNVSDIKPQLTSDRNFLSENLPSTDKKTPEPISTFSSPNYSH